MEKYFHFSLLIGLISIYLVFTKMKSEWADARGEPFDWKGSAFYGVSLFAFMFGFQDFPLSQDGYYWPRDICRDNFSAFEGK